MKVYVYAIYFPTSNKYYIGYTNNLNKRMLRHLENNYLVGKALYKYKDWQVSILHICKTRDEAKRIEIKEIIRYNCIVPNGYNMTKGGDGTSGHRHSKKQKEKWSKERKGCKGNFKNKRHSNESRKNISKNHADISGNKNPMRRPEIAIKFKGKNNPMCRPEVILKAKISNLKRYILKLEQGLND